MTTHHRVAIVGTGFSGLGMAIQLKRDGEHDFVVLEKASDLGGTWRDNSYPGCACDVPSHLYSFSFAPNPEWSNTYSPQPEIWAYLRDCAERFGITDHILYDHALEHATWDEAARRWRLDTPHGEITADVLVAGPGALSEPSVPAIAGADRFGGQAFHSQTWDHDLDLTGKRVAVIGTGASAIQFVPQIQKQAAEVTLYQRTPPWIIPRPARPISALERGVFKRIPAVQRLIRTLTYWNMETRVLGLALHPRFMKIPEFIARRHLGRQVKDPQLRAKLTPDYTIGCKRILISNDYYPALGRDNVEVVTEAIGEITEGGVVTADGTERAADVIVYGTGFHVTDIQIAKHIKGRGGEMLADAWADGASAYKGTTVAGFPNFFLLTGPNTGLGHSSMVFMIESQVAYVLDALRTMQREDVAAVEVRAQAQAAYNAGIDAQSEGSAWTDGGCKSWYLDKNGRNATLWPDFTFKFRRELSEFDRGAYQLDAAPDRARVVA